MQPQQSSEPVKELFNQLTEKLEAQKKSPPQPEEAPPSLDLKAEDVHSHLGYGQLPAAEPMEPPGEPGVSPGPPRAPVTPRRSRATPCCG